MFKINEDIEVAKLAEEALDNVQYAARVTERQIERTVVPIRKSVAERFPTLFLLLITFGCTAMVTGIEHSLVKYQILAMNPEVIFLIGVGILVLTGTLYKKLG